jgi:hypothetical protein
MPAKNINRLSTQNVFPAPPADNFSKRTYGEILSDVGESLKGIVQDDVSLMVDELKQIQDHLGAEAKKIAAYGFLLFFSGIAILISAIIGLGIFLDGRYWLSSLIVGLVFLVCGGVGLTTAYRRFKKVNMDFPETKSALRQEGRAIYKELNKVRDVVTGEENELH